ncbi:MAG: hypothetical protein E6Q88_12330 [Lysobacteraceae bacterium]|nr:MAG: hypothetical protein E6Q88_12330 [Xanthomonadaceae bacterium]
MIRWLLLFVLIAAAAWWFFTPETPSPSFPTSVAGAGETTTAAVTVQGCALPALLAGGDGAAQSELPGAMSPFKVQGGALKPLAGFSVAARVLSRKEYGSGREADFSPLDLALGWGRMREDTVLSDLDITQSGRWYRYQWSGHPPIPPDEIVRSSANMHMIPSNNAIADALDAVEEDDQIRIDGWLVQVEATDGWRWRSSLRRDDSGAGACEVVYVCAVTR